LCRIAISNSEKEGSTPETLLGSESSRKEKKDKRRKHQSSDSSAIVSVPQTTLTAITTTAHASDSEAKAFLQKHRVTVTTPDNAPAVTPVITFDQLNIPEGLRTAFTDFKEPSPIQACTWPPALDGRDVVGIAETGR
jgi:ATP-dependent RNA helicase DBP3